MEVQETLPAALRLLVVDDEPIVGKRLRQAYAKLGFEVETFTSGAPALAAMAEHPFEIVVTDLMMAGVDGWEVLRRVRDLSPAARVIVITAYAGEDTAAEARRQGAFDCLAKPFRLEALKQSIFRAWEEVLRQAG